MKERECKRTTMVSAIYKVMNIAEDEGWAVEQTKEGKNAQLLFSQFTPAGHDFNFEIEVKGDKLKSFMVNFEEYIEDFDPDYEATFWQKDGHGIKGAPYRLKDIITDFEKAQGMMMQLYNTINDRLNCGERNYNITNN